MSRLVACAVVALACQSGAGGSPGGGAGAGSGGDGGAGGGAAGRPGAGPGSAGAGGTPGGAGGGGGGGGAGAGARGAAAPPGAGGSPAAASDGPRPAGDGAPAAGRAPLVLAIIVDQLAAWVAETRLEKLPPDGGFARLRREGTWVKDLRYLHAATDTGAGHAALFAAAPPRVTGIIANELVGDGGGLVAILSDGGVRLVGPDGMASGTGSSPRNLAAETLGDRLRAASADAIIVGVSIKDRSAIFGCGRRPTACLWYDAGRESFVTSTAFSTAFPDWARPLATREALRARWRDPWALTDRAWVMANAATPDDQAGEGSFHGLGTVFPHSVAGASRPGEAFKATPFADEAVLDLGLRAVEALGAGQKASLVSLSLSGYDWNGHVFGPDSWEAWDHLRRIDAGLARLFTALDARLGAGGWAALLTSDHGIAPLPETATRPQARPWCAGGGMTDKWQRPCGAGSRMGPSALGSELRAAAEQAIGAGSWVSGVSEPWVFFTSAARALPADRRDALVAALTRTLMGHTGVERVIDARRLATCGPATDESIDNLVCRVHFERHGAGLYIVAKPGAIFETYYATGRGSNHGGPYLFDRSVPLLVRAPGRAPAGRVVEGPLPYTAFARTAATLLGIEPPGEAAAAPDLTRP
jgi:hypothetical protein